MLCAAFMVAGHAVANDNLSESTTSSTPTATVVDIALPEDSVVQQEQSDKYKPGIGKGVDVSMAYGPKSKSLDLLLGVDLGKYAYIPFAWRQGMGDDSALAFLLGLGPKYRYMGDTFMAFGSAYVYGGYKKVEYEIVNEHGKKEDKKQRDFSYGLGFDFKLGACVQKSSTGRMYVSVGYFMNAEEFEFEKIGKFGSVSLSLTMEF